MKKILLLIFLLFPISVFATETGKITEIFFCGDADGNHKNIVQIRLSTGFHLPGCNTEFAAARIADKELVAALILAYETDKTISIELSPTDKYFGDRAVIYRVSFKKE